MNIRARKLHYHHKYFSDTRQKYNFNLKKNFLCNHGYSTLIDFLQTFGEKKTYLYKFRQSTKNNN